MNCKVSACSFRRGIKSLSLAVLCFFSFQFFFACKNSRQPVVIWTDCPELVSYVEFYNVTQNKSKAVVVYKEHLANSLPPAKDEKKPDLIIGSFLKNSKTKKYFAPLDSILGKDEVNRQQFYEKLLDYGIISGKQYLLPVSFNLPVMIFSADNFVSDATMLDCEGIRKSAASFNKKNKNDIFTNMGFGPSWNPEFIYEVTKAKSSDFVEKGNYFTCSEEKLNDAVEYIKSWISKHNGGTDLEQDFEFKYLYTPEYKQIESGHCLYAYIKSSNYFSLSSEHVKNVDYRWFSENNKICVEDDIVTLGIYKKSHNDDAAKNFAGWLLSDITQKNLLERAERMNLDTKAFGICNGFSSIKNVNERVYPSYYKNLLGNFPSDENLKLPSPLPPRWYSLKERVVIPYLIDATKTDAKTTPKTIEERLNVWRKQFL